MTDQRRFHPRSRRRRPRDVIFAATWGAVLLLTFAVANSARAQEPSIDRLLAKLPRPESLVKRPMQNAMPAGDPAAKDPLGKRIIHDANLGYFRTALNSCRELEARYPRSFGVWCLHGIIAWEAQQFREAIAAFSKATEINPRAAFGHYGL